MKFVTGMMMLSVFALVGCSSTKKSGEEKIETEKPTHVVLEVSQPTRPTWILDPIQGDEAKERKKNRYFTDQSENVNQRLCVRSAEARATSKIAREIAQFLKNSYTEATQNTDGDENAETYMDERLAQEAQSFIVGARSHKTFWEKRKYKEELGADEDKTIYNCHALVKMDKKDLEKAVKNAKAKLLSNIKDPEVKKNAQKSLEAAEQAFSNLEKPVQLEGEE